MLLYRYKRKTVFIVNFVFLERAMIHLLVSVEAY